MKVNPYVKQVKQTLPRILAMFDVDQTNKSYGLGDRYYWAWGLIDFSNGTYQGATHGLARLWKCGLWPYKTSKEKFIQRIDAIFEGSGRLTRKNGSLEESFPNEGSFCVTALVAFDLVCTLELLKKEIDTETFERWQHIVRPMISYLMVNNETHAIISNHLATAAAALVRWHRLTQKPDVEIRARQLIEDILKHQSSEGWFKEYEGADPGYQSLCTYYLSDIHIIRTDWNLLEPLRKSIQFLWHFAHPDGSFGGLYGSRCTRFYYPAGLEALAFDIPEAASLAHFMAQSITQNSVVTLNTMDDSNLIPMFNNYCCAAALWNNTQDEKKLLTLPALSSVSKQKQYKSAGLFIDSGHHHYTIIATNRGGVIYHFVEGKLVLRDAGVVVRDSRGRLGSTQGYNQDVCPVIEENSISIHAPIFSMPKRLPHPTQFIVLRLLCISLFRFSWTREWVKRLLVSLLITGTKPWPVFNRREIYLGQTLSIKDKLDLTSGYKVIKTLHEFVPIHMASQGYWQIHDEEEPRI